MTQPQQQQIQIKANDEKSLRIDRNIVLWCIAVYFILVAVSPYIMSSGGFVTRAMFNGIVVFLPAVSFVYLGCYLYDKFLKSISISKWVFTFAFVALSMVTAWLFDAHVYRLHQIATHEACRCMFYNDQRGIRPKDSLVQDAGPVKFFRYTTESFFRSLALF